MDFSSEDSGRREARQRADLATRLPFGLPVQNQKRQVSSTAREPWKATTRNSLELSDAILPNLAKQAAGIGAWVPKPQRVSKGRSRNEDSLPQIEEIANRIADRYAGGLAKLSQVQREWRQKHDALVRKRLLSGHDDLHAVSREERPPALRGSLTARVSSAADDDRGLTLSDRASPHRARSSATTPRRGPKKKKVVAVFDDEVTDQLEEEDKGQSIHEMLKTGFSDLFHAKRDDIAQTKPEPLNEDLVFARGPGRPTPKAAFEELQVVSPGSETQASSAEEVLEDHQADPLEIIGDEAELAVAAAVDSAVGTATGEVESPTPQVSATDNTSAMEEDNHELTRSSSKRSVPYRPDVAVRQASRNPSHRRTATWMRPRAAEEKGDDDRHGRELSYATCSELAKKHRLTVVQVRQALEEYLTLDKNKDGRLSFDEFEQAIRDRCAIPVGQAVPPHLLNLNWNKADKDGDAEICFEEFLLWSTEHAFTEELVVLDPKERYLRELARKHNFTLDEVERCHKTFNASDSNRNGFIEEVEFRQCVAALWKCELEDISATRLRQFWLEADKARMGKLGFEVFLVWYMTIGVR